jgi:hypothetical protein
MEAQFGYSELLEGMPVAVATASFFLTDSRNSCHLAQRRSGLIGCVSRLPAIDFIAGCATSLPLKPLRSPDQNDNLFENRSKTL